MDQAAQVVVVVVVVVEVEAAVVEAKVVVVVAKAVAVAKVAAAGKVAAAERAAAAKSPTSPLKPQVTSSLVCNLALRRCQPRRDSTNRLKPIHFTRTTAGGCHFPSSASGFGQYSRITR